MIKKIIFIIILFLTFISQTVAYENIISSLVINGEDEREIDMVMDKGKILLPCKYFLNYFKIPFKENHADKSLSFKNSTLRGNGYFVNDKKENTQVVFVKKTLTEVQNEFFVPAETLSTIVGKKVSTDSNQLLAFLQTTNGSKTEDENKNIGDIFRIESGIKKPQAYEEITLPVQKGWLSLDKIGIRENMFSDSYSQIYRDSQSKTTSFNNNLQATLSGRLNSGEYKLDLGTNSYAKDWLNFSGVSFQYKNGYKNFEYLIGKPDSWDFGDTTVSFDLVGVQLRDKVEEDVFYKNIEGNVHKNSTIKVYLNDNFEKEISTYGGYYSLKDLYYKDEVKKIRIEELLADGSKKEIFKKEYDLKTQKKQHPKRDFILGINGLQNRFWAKDAYIYQNTTKKGVVGAKYYKKISNKLSFENFLIADKILSSQNNSGWRSVLGDKRYLNYSTMQNFNALSGETYMGVLSYLNNEKMNSNLYFGASHSKSSDDITQDGVGYFLKYENIYNLNETTHLTSSLFASSPNFYMAGNSSAGDAVPDKMGAKLGGNSKYKNISFSGYYSKYASNFGNYYEGGLLNFDEYDFMAKAAFKKMPSLSLKINNKRGGNEIGEISSSSYELSSSKKIKCFSFAGGIKKTSYSNQYSAPGYSSYSSEYSDIFTEARFPLGKRFGYFGLGHDIVNTKANETENKYNSINFQYSTPSIKGFNFNLSSGIHYSGTNKGNDFGLGITKRLKSGSSVSVNYKYSQIPCYIIDNMYIPGSMRHSVTVDFSELYGLGSRGLEPIGMGNDNKGFIQVIAFLDVNQNGIQDKGEPSIENVPFKIEDDSEILFTEKNGQTKLRPEEAGIHNVKIFEDELPTTLSGQNNVNLSKHVKINSQTKTKVKFGLISSVGNINGSVTIKDEFNNNLQVEDLIVSVFDVAGKEVCYTNLNEDGTFSFSGLSPGKYIVAIDKELQNLYKITPDKDSENYVIEIPAQYKDYVNIDNVNLNYKYQL